MEWKHGMLDIVVCENYCITK